VSACKDCPRRTVEPNCHNVETCPDWAKEEAKKAERYRKKQDEMMLSETRVHYDKSSGRYIPGLHPYIKKIKTRSIQREEKDE
jgi:hypothetical protein